MATHLLAFLFGWEPGMEPSFLRLDSDQTARDALAPFLPAGWVGEDLIGVDLWNEDQCLDRPARELLEGDLIAVHLQGQAPMGWETGRWLLGSDPQWECLRRGWQSWRPEVMRDHAIALHRPLHPRFTVKEGPYRTAKGEESGWPRRFSPLRALCPASDGVIYCLTRDALCQMKLPVVLQELPLPEACRSAGDGSGFTDLDLVGETLYLVSGGRVYCLRRHDLSLLPCSHHPAVQLFDTFSVHFACIREDRSAILVGGEGEVARLPADGGRTHLLRLRHRGRALRPEAVWAHGEMGLVRERASGVPVALRWFDLRTGLPAAAPAWLADIHGEAEVALLTHGRIAMYDSETGRVTVGDGHVRHYSFGLGDGRPIPGGLYAHGHALLQLLDNRYLGVAEVEESSGEGAAVTDTG